jgi:hypothetical protein
LPGSNPVHDELLRVGVGRRGLRRSLGELVDAQHQLHWIGRRLRDLSDKPLVHKETDSVSCPFRGVVVKVAGVDLKRDALEVVGDRRIAERVDTHANSDRPVFHVVSEDLEDADLCGLLRLVLEPDHPERDHVRRVSQCPRAALEEAVLRGVPVFALLCLPDDDLVAEAVLAHQASHRPGEGAGLQGGDPRPAVPFRAPRLLIPLYPKAEDAAVDGESGRRRCAGAPLGEVMGQPERLVQRSPVKLVLDLEKVARPIETLPPGTGRARAPHDGSLAAPDEAPERVLAESGRRERRQALTATSFGFDAWPSAAARARERSRVRISARR